uniref:Plexin-B1 n=1 Tax=Echeneis naucrates TaxID=173247 RepID=A0A665W7W0_ECHNA
GTQPQQNILTILWTIIVLHPTFTRNDTVFEHLALHPDDNIGRVYIGAQDQLFQLDRFLQPELQDTTGPVTDSRECLPPVTESNCPQARVTSNHNKLLLVDPYSMELITCGSVNQGICQKRSLDSVDLVLFSTTRPVDTQYVAANHPNVSTVGLVVRSHPDKQPVLFVGRGYTSSHPPISTRNLVLEPIFSYEETAKLAVAGRLSEYDHHFVASFAHHQHVYFLFYRRDLKSQSREYRTYISRVCLDDQAYYSYVEVPLTCRSRPGKIYNLLQAVQLGLSKDDEVNEGSDILLGVFSTHLASSTQPSEDSALCMFNLEDVDRRINSTRDLCYTQMGRETAGEAAYIEYEVKSNCANLPENTLDAYPCGSDHTPSPMASRIAVEAETILDSPSARLTAVSISVRAGHTIAFLGDSKGNLHKVFLGPNGEVEEYSVISIQRNTAINADLILDQKEEHLFIMTRNMLQKRPVAECQQHTGCHSCLLAHDPYCGWCVLEGRCVLQSECARGNQLGQWLWSFDIEQQCLTIQDLSPSNISREESKMVSLSVSGLPVLAKDEIYSCFFQDQHSPATVTTTGVKCLSPNSSRLYVSLAIFPACPHLCTHKTSIDPVTSAITQEVTTPPAPTPPPTTSPGITTPPTTLPSKPTTILSPTTAVPSMTPPIVGTTRKDGTVAGELTSVTTPSTNGAAFIPSVALVTSEPAPVIVSELSRESDPVMSLMIPDSSPLEVVIELSPSKSHDAEEALSLPQPPTLASSANSELHQDLTHTTIPMPTQDIESRSLEVLLWSKEEVDVYTNSAVQSENDTATFSAATVLSGDGEVDHAHSSNIQLLDTESQLDYQYDPAEAWGSSACPCVEKVQGSSLLPVRAERKITLLARNLHLYQVQQSRILSISAPVSSDSVCLQEFLYQTEFVFFKRDTFHVDSSPDLYVTLYNCSVGRTDCSRCHTADQKYGCVWCGTAQASCLYSDSCNEPVQQICPAPVIHSIEPLSSLLEGGTMVTISGSNLGQKAEDILDSVSVAGVACTVIPSLYEVSSRIVCRTKASGGERVGHVSVKVSGGGLGQSKQTFSYQDPFVMGVSPERGPKAGGTCLTITGRNLLTGRPSDLTITVGGVPCNIFSEVQRSSVQCVTGSSNRTGDHRITVHYGISQRHLHTSPYCYTHNPNITHSTPAKSFMDGGRLIYVSGQYLDVVQEPRMVVTVNPLELISLCVSFGQNNFMERCEVNSSSLILCRSPMVDSSVWGSKIRVEFLLDNLRFDFSKLNPEAFSYEPNPILHRLNQQEPLNAYRYNPGSFIQLEGENLDLAITKDEIVVMVGEGVCAVKTLTRNHLYCEPPPQQPAPGPNGKKREGSDNLPEFTVQIGNLNFSLGKVLYDNLSLSTFPLEAQIGAGVGASIVALIVLIIVLIYRRKSKQALRDYKKVQIQLENLETSVRDRCKKEFTDLMTEMMDMSSDLVGSGIPFLDYRMYAERIFFPGHRESPLKRDLDVQECRRQTVEQGLVQLSNLLNSKLFLTKFIHTLESQRTFSPRDRAYVASLLTVALHGKLEYFTDILKTLLNDLVDQYVAKNAKLMLRRTETVVEKLLTNWMSICLYAFLRDSAGESLYMLFRAIKHQVDKGPVDAVTGKAKYTLNDNRLLREDVEYKTLTLNVLVQDGGMNEMQPLPSKVLDCDTITQVKEKLLDQVFKGTSFSHRPHADSLDLEWRSGVAGHLILSDEDLTSVVQGNWKRLNTLQHYKVPDGATVALVPRHNKNIHHDNHEYVAGEKTPMLEDADEGGMRFWHLVKATEEPELPKHRRGSLRERERAKAIPEIYLTRLLSMKGTLQKFVDDLFTVILSTSRPVPLAVKYFFDLLDDQAGQHGISDPETIHIWKTNSLPLRFWINIVKNPQFIFDVQASDHVDAVLSVIAQTFMDSCTIAEHKLGRDSPINKLLYARDIPRYKQMVERYYADIRQTISASDQEMNSALAELSRNYSGELNYLVALHELYKYINKYYDQIITALEEDTMSQKMQLGYRLQQIAAAVENKVTDL